MGTETKACPFCSEQIALSAKKCRFCNEWLNQKAELASKISWQGSRILLPIGATIPSGTCWICGNDGPQMGRKAKKYYYTPPWVYLGLLGGLLPVIVLALIFQKSATVSVPLCGPCRKRWFLADLTFGVFAVVGFFVMPFAGGVLGNSLSHDVGAFVGGVCGFCAWIVGMIALNYALVLRAQVKSTFIDDKAVTLQLPNPQAVKGSFKDRAEP